MTIIKRGNPKPKVEDMIGECDQCSCVFTFGEHESRRYSNNGGGSVYFATCPQCVIGQGKFDTGYPGLSEKDRESNRSVKEEQARLRAIKATTV